MLELTQENFSATIKDNDMVVVDFWAPWCGPCRMFAPIFERTAETLPDITFAKLNTEDEQLIAGALQVVSIPTLMVFREGALIFRQPGALNQSQLTETLKKLQALDMDELRKRSSEKATPKASGKVSEAPADAEKADPATQTPAADAKAADEATQTPEEPVAE